MKRISCKLGGNTSDLNIHRPRFRRVQGIFKTRAPSRTGQLCAMFLKAAAITLVLGAGAHGAMLHANKRAAAGGYIQSAGPGQASFTMYSGCNQPACGIAANGYSAAISQLAFGSAPGLGPGDACGRCFALTGTADPYSPAYTGPFGQSIVVKVSDMCPVAGNEAFCGQTASNQANMFNMPVHFDICEDTGGSAVFFPNGHGALTGTFQEVSCSMWKGSGDGSPLWTGACISGENAPLWPSTGCGNQGTAPGANSPPASTTGQPTTTTGQPTTTGTSTTTAPSRVATHFAQCGGTGWTGPTTCQSPYTCQAVSPPYYSQCL
ncbi:RlpA-like double-psi beta-barrel-protein domain-containing protein-containing protein [Roridomyces roridus]|uniref:RlpA-like double-psi beta-barrel-protein domain-containing protein-containing protein n=1 Tax=Roridomyces roridus TaxID=1738132 RepID=A0AAD7FK32_9AGAR|nr:RlpA-like double-psi beta-barrel-protein domain-containing protein-containing protein [Roridomyces roridus]